MEEANQRASDARLQRAPRLPEEDRLRAQRVESLKLSRARVLSQLERANAPAYREVLMKALQALEKETDEMSRANEEQ